jgi:tricarballylate dehydrogenase
VADSVAGLAEALNVPTTRLEATVERFNRSIRPGHYDDSVLDDCRTEGLEPNKTHWARPLDTPPYSGYPLRPGITFTYLALKVNQRTQVLMQDGKAATNIYAAGEIMAGNILRHGYLAGLGMTIGTVFGRIAGEEAARHATQ